MECWGTGPMDNDAALAWLQELQSIGAVSRAVASDDHDVAYAGCGLVAWAVGWPMPEDPLECGAAEREQLANLRRQALRRLTALRAEDSELYQLWADSESLADWLDTVDSMVTVLGALQPAEAGLKARLTTPEQHARFEGALDDLYGDTPKRRKQGKDALASLSKQVFGTP